VTFFIFAGGPSLTPRDVAACKGLGQSIAINNAIFLAPWADMMIGGDRKWWDWVDGARWFKKPRYTAHRSAAAEIPHLIYLQPTGLSGFEWEFGKIRTGGNSGYVAIQLAAQLGARQIVLLGYDMQPSDTGSDHWHAPHPDGSHPGYALCAPRFDSLVEPLAARQIAVYNCSPATALRAFPCCTLSQVLSTLSSSSTPTSSPTPNAPSPNTSQF
jgi:hypothetical protein